MIVTKISLADLHCARLYYTIFSTVITKVHTHIVLRYIGTERGWMPMKRVWWPTWSSSNSVSRALDDSNIAAVSKVHNNNNVFHIWLGLAKLISCIRKHTSNDSPNSFSSSSSTDDNFLLFLTIQKSTKPKRRYNY